MTVAQLSDLFVSIVWGKGVPFLFVLTIVVFFHELGHFLVGRWCGIRVLTFSIGFGPELIGWTDRVGTRWRIALLPLGGFVRFLGEPDAMGEHAEAGAVSPDRSGSFAEQPVWKRFLTVLAGPVASLLLGVVIFSSTAWLYGRVIILPKIEMIVPDSAAAEAGFLAGDTVRSVDGMSIESFSDLQQIVALNAGVALNVIVDRGGQDVALVAVPRMLPHASAIGVRRTGVLGIAAGRDPASFVLKQETLPGALAFGVRETWQVVANSVHFITGLFSGRTSADQLSGPVGIANMAGEVAKVGVTALIGMAGFLSVSIGFLNLLPVPLLDGGHLALYLLESLRRRPIGTKAMELAFRIGFLLLAALTLFSLYVDLR